MDSLPPFSHILPQQKAPSSDMDPKPKNQKLKPVPIHYVSSTDSTEFTHLTHTLHHAAIIGLDAEWKPIRTRPSTFPTVSLLQLACRVNSPDPNSVMEVFLVDLIEIEMNQIWETLKEMFVNDGVLKLGFKFKQDLVFLSSTFCKHGCEPGFDVVEPYIDIASLYHLLQQGQPGTKSSKDNKSLAAICEDVLGVTLSKELQCSDWSCRPLTEEQKTYAAADAQCLVEIFDFLQDVVLNGDVSSHNVLGLKECYEDPDSCDIVSRQNYFQVSTLARSATTFECDSRTCVSMSSQSSISCVKNPASSSSFSKVIELYGEKLELKESDTNPSVSKKKGKRHPPNGSVIKQKQAECFVDYRGPPPWDSSLGGDGCPKFLCDVMVEGLARHLRCVGIDAAIPYSKKPDPRQLIDQASKEKRVLLTRDAKILKHEYLIPNQVHRVMSLLKNDQLLEVIHKFNLKIHEDKLMSRCTKCNGMFIQKPLTTGEAIEAAKGFQIIPNCLFDRSLEFWQCMDCKQLYWEGTQYHNAIQKFVDICNIK